MHIVAFCARKGGTGKATLALQLASRWCWRSLARNFEGDTVPLPFTGIILCWFMSHFHPLAKSTEVPRMNPT